MFAFQRERVLGAGSQHYAVGSFLGIPICTVCMDHIHTIMFVFQLYLPYSFSDFISLAKNSSSILKHIKQSGHIYHLDFRKSACILLHMGGYWLWDIVYCHCYIKICFCTPYSLGTFIMSACWISQ